MLKNLYLVPFLLGRHPQRLDIWHCSNSSLGSGSTHAKRRKSGYEHHVEPGKIVKGILTFGLWRLGWMQVDYPDYPSVWRYEADFFEPWKWRPKYPNPAFDRMDAADAFWAANIVSRFTDKMIRAIVAESRISDPEAVAYLTDVIITRRNKVVNYWISRTNPLDRFEVQSRAGVRGGVTILSVSGRVSSRENSVLLKDTINSAVQRGHLHVALDLQRVPYIDSCGLGAIVGGHTIVSLQGGRLLLLNLAECLRDLLRVMKLETVLEIFDSEQEAVRSVSPETAA